MREVVVVGAGISGLSAARELSSVPEVRVTVLEAAPAVGGKLRVGLLDGVAVDEGAEQLLVRPSDGVDLLDAVGLADAVIHPAATGASVWSRGRLRPLPAGTVLGVPTEPLPLIRSRLLSVRGLARASADLVLPRTSIDGDVAVGAYVRARLGHEVVDLLVDPLLGGVYAGHADGLSLAATVPQLAAHVRAHRSLVRAARAARAESPAQPGPVFASLQGGLGRLPTALAGALPATVRTRATVRELAHERSGFLVVYGDTRSPRALRADAVVIAVPGPPAARLLQPVSRTASALVGQLDYASVGIVTLSYRARDVPTLHGTGFLVPAVEGRVVKAVTYVSAKWAHDPAGPVIVRASVGRYGDEQVLRRDDDAIAASVAADVAEMTGIRGAPVATRVTRWGGALPQYAPGHVDRVHRMRAALPAGVVVCGAAYDGVGVPACIRSGREAAEVVRTLLRQSGSDREEEAP